ncbi:Asparagine ligase A [Kitasatospora sp. MMS16-BH015]|uniref:amino acid--tRNA ligase-related protein n=1 Tax=Kitasatospora sp. MMS16-BH015 TaxID=2018025 RepID=UPI000CA3663B|nr:amino acid--tRNA ligase-related protein [Kitasatospora sp. MMS16-BH015]AUG77448.1 Asparagine ligase A [Kitasatospora sp. MMS16-BH015]
MPPLVYAPEKITAPGTFAANEPGAFLAALRSPWYALIAELHDTVLSTTVNYGASRGLRSLYLPLTTRTITCPSGLGSDTRPVPVTVNGVDTYLPDSMQFLLEWGCQVSPGGGYTIMPSFRDEVPDKTHLGQFTHSEAELPGGLDDLIRYVEGYVKALAATILDRHGEQLARSRGDISHLERMVAAGGFSRLTFDEAVDVLADEPGCISDQGKGRNLTRKGERLLMSRISEFLWVTHFDHLTVPFYQAFGDSEGRTARNADLLFGMGEVVGSGERHTHGAEVRKALAMHDVPENEYAWYVQMKDEMPLRTSGFGMGVERFLMWVLNHDDIRDMSLVSRVDEPASWPAAVLRP